MKTTAPAPKTSFFDRLSMAAHSLEVKCFVIDIVDRQPAQTAGSGNDLQNQLHGVSESTKSCGVSFCI